MAADPKEFEAITPSTTGKLEWCGRTITVRPLKVGQIPGFAKAVAPILAAVPATSGSWEDMDVVGMIASHGEALIAACAIAAPEATDAEIRDAELDSFMVLIAEILSVNADFFRRRMPQAGPKLAGMVASLGDGSTRSKP
jgi:hypothetical protein